MTGIRHRFLAVIGLAGALALGGCAYDDGYGYGGVNVGSGYYGGGGYYGDGYYGPSGYYQPGLYSGWYDNYYYPGSGYYVYDRGGRRHRWNDGQRRYWEGRHAERRGDGHQRGDYWRGGNRNPGHGGNRWRGHDGTRPTPQPGLRQPHMQSQPRSSRPHMNQPRPQRSWGGGGRSGGHGGGRVHHN